VRRENWLNEDHLLRDQTSQFHLTDPDVIVPSSRDVSKWLTGSALFPSVWAVFTP